MGVLVGVMFLGTVVPRRRQRGAAVRAARRSCHSSGERCSGPDPSYYILQLATMGILILAANTAFADFPRLASLLARDAYMPQPVRVPR